MVQAIAHRGPDGSRITVEGPVGLGHARLRVIDLSEAADQPMWNEDRTVGIVYNGEIYNFRELSQELESGGRVLRTQSDTEVILRLYEKLGIDAIWKLDGMFALGIWDRVNERLVLARDRTGKKPLFYWRDGDRFVFGSEIKALHAHPQVPRQPDLTTLPHFLTYGYFPGTASAYQGIHKLPPATVLTVNLKGETEHRRYWTPPFETNGIHRKEEAVARLDDLMRKAVERRLISDVPIGAFLSGGLDSTLIVGLMSRAMRSPVRTFSIGFEGESAYDETEYAELAARSFGTDHTTFRVAPPNEALLERLVHFHDGPFGDSSAIPTYLVSQLAREHVTVVLNGDGGDELFAGYQRFAAAIATERIPRWLRSCAQPLSALIPEPKSWTSRSRRVKRLLEVAALPAEERYRAWCSIFPRVGGHLLPGSEEIEQSIADVSRPYFEAAEGTVLAKLLYLNFCTYLPEDLLVKVDRCSMAHGLEARSPFLDTAVMEFAGRLPDRYKLRGWTTKYILRETFRDLIPDAILRRSKMGFGVPMGSWLRGRLADYMLDHLQAPRSRIYEHVQQEPVQRMLGAHLSGQADFGPQLFCLLTLEMWLRTF
jgi:asparagine synthase (glutamine-hydrolysing)